MHRRTPKKNAKCAQVYKGVLRASGEVVAVKVQRPGVAASIALDVFILRKLATAVRRWRRLNSDLPALLDEWAASLFKVRCGGGVCAPTGLRARARALAMQEIRIHKEKHRESKRMLAAVFSRASLCRRSCRPMISRLILNRPTIDQSAN